MGGARGSLRVAWDGNNVRSQMQGIRKKGLHSSGDPGEVPAGTLHAVVSAAVSKRVMSKKMSILIQLAHLRDVLHQMEQDLGLDGLNRKERDILLAFYANATEDTAHGYISSTDRVRAHPTLETVSQPTFHRALRRLLERGLVVRHDGLPAGIYAIPGGEALASVA